EARVRRADGGVAAARAPPAARGRAFGGAHRTSRLFRPDRGGEALRGSFLSSPQPRRDPLGAAVLLHLASGLRRATRCATVSASASNSPARRSPALTESAPAAVATPPPVAPPAEGGGGPETRARDLDRSLIKGIAWTGAMRWGTQALSWASTLVVAHLLSPTDYGLVAMALVYLGLAQLINEFGLGTVIVMRRDLTESQIARLGGLSVLLGAGFVGVSALVAGLVARFFGEPIVRWLVIVSSATFLTGSLQVVPRALLAKDLDFRRLAWADATEGIVTTFATLTFALLGLHFWALVLGPIVGRTT